MSNDIDSGGFSEGPEGDSDYTGDDSFDESDYGTSNDYEEVEYDYQLAEDPVPLEEVCHHQSSMKRGIKLASPDDQSKHRIRNLNAFQAPNSGLATASFKCNFLRTAHQERHQDNHMFENSLKNFDFFGKTVASPPFSEKATTQILTRRLRRSCLKTSTTLPLTTRSPSNLAR